MLRQHQFTKVELVSLVEPEHSKDELERMLSCAEQILKEANTHNHSHDHSHKENDRKKIQSTTKPQPAKKAKSIASKTKKTKKVSKK